MKPTSSRPALLAAGAAALLLASGCGGGPGSAAKPKPGTIGYAWATAGEAYTRGEYVGAMEHLSRVAATQNEYREKAQLQLAVVSSGIADGYMELAKAYEDGAKYSKAQSSEFKKKMMEARNLANQAAMQFAETTNDILKTNKDLKVAFDFPFPEGSVADPVQLTKVQKGYPVHGADFDVLREAMVKRGVVKFAASLAGAPDSPEKAKAQWANPPHDAVVKAITTGLYTKADLYCQRKLDIPKRGNVLCQKALETLALLPDSKERKELEGKIKEELKRHRVES